MISPFYLPCFMISSFQGGTAYRGVKMKEDILIPPTGGWSAATLYIAVNPTADAMKRKREEEVTQGSGVNKMQQTQIS